MSVSPGHSWVWVGNNLYDAAHDPTYTTPVASVRADVLHVRDQQFLIEALSAPLTFRYRATAVDGPIITVTKESFTVSCLRVSVHCAQTVHPFALPRTSLWRKERALVRVDAAGKAVHDVKLASIRPRMNGRVELIAEKHVGVLSFPELVVMSWACVLVDAPLRRAKY